MTAQQQAARTAMERRRTVLGNQIAEWRLVEPDQTDQVDAWDAARAMVLMHMGVNVRRYLYRAHIGTPEQLEARLVREPDVTGWATKTGEGSQVVAAEFWLEFFTFVRLEEWNIDEVDERVVLKRDYLTLEPLHRRPERDTSDFVRFYRALWQWISFRKRCKMSCVPNASLLLRDIVLLYFVRSCLLHKNGREVLDLPHFDWLGKPGRDVVWQFLLADDPRQEETRLNDIDYLSRIAPLQESWNNLLRMFSFGIARRYKLSGLVAMPSNVVTKDQMEGEDDDEEFYEEEAGPQPPEREEEDAPEQPPTVPARDDVTNGAQELGAELCPLHDHLQDGGDHLCPTKCTRPNKQTTVRSSKWMDDLTRCQPSVSRTHMQQTAVMLAIGAEQPDVTRVLLGGGAPIMRPHQNGCEWAAAMSGFKGAPTQDPLAMEAVDALALHGGWQNAPQPERLARYATVHGAGDHMHQAFVGSGWTINSTLERRISAWKNTNPRPPHRALQTLAACLQ